MPKVIALAGCIICDENGGVLMLHRNTSKRTQWEIPGGSVEAHEDPKTAAVRELQEEMGVKVNVLRQLGERAFIEDDVQFHYTWFLAEVTAGEPALMEPELYDRFGYFSLVNLSRRYDELSANTKNFLEAMAYGEIDLAV